MASGAAERVLVDTGPLVAIFSALDEHHRECVEQLRALPAPLLTSWPVLTETAYLLRRSPPAVIRMLASVETSWLRILHLGDDAAAWCATFFERFADREPQLADASLVYLAETHALHRVFTLDRRDFAVYRTRNDRALHIVP